MEASLAGLPRIYGCVLTRVQLFATLWTVAHQAPLSMGFFQARILEWIAISSSKGIFLAQAWNPVSLVSYIIRQILYHTAPLRKPIQDSKGSLNHSITIVNPCLVKRASNYCPPKSSFLPSTNSTKIALKGLTQYINISAVPGIVKIIVMTGV